MKLSLACAGLVLGLGLGGCATPMTKNPSPHFSKVTSHLDLGGKVFLYTDIEGDLPAGAEQLDRIIARVGKVSPELHLERINVKRLLGQLGLDNLQAFGLSSTQEGKVSHNKAFVQHQGPRRGLLLLTGEAPRDLEIIRQAPGNADLVFETDIRIKSLLNLLEGILKDILGPDAKDVLGVLEEKMPDGSLTIRKVIEQLDTRIVGVLRTDIPQGFVLPNKGQGKPMTLDLLISADNLSVLFDAADRLLQMAPTIKRSQDGDWQLLEMAVPLPEISGLVPVLAKNGKTGRVFLASNMGFVKEFLADKSAGKKLVDSADFKAASAGFSPQANSLSYLSGAFFPKVAQLARAFGKNDKDVQTGIDLFLDLLPDGSLSFASQQVNLPDGLYYASNSAYSYKTALFAPLLAMPAVVAGIAAAVAIPSFKSKQARSSKQSVLDQNIPNAMAGLEACIDAVTTLHKRSRGMTGKPKSRTAAAAMSLPPTLPVVCPNPRNSSTDLNLDGYRTLGWTLINTRDICYQYKRDTLEKKGAPEVFSCHAWIDQGEGPSAHWSAQGTWDATKGAWEVKDPDQIED